MNEVVIDGIHYYPETELETEAKELLCSVYGSLWAEAEYDALNHHTEKFAKPLSDKMLRLNEILRFKK